MKKLFTLLTLLVAIVTGAQAQTVTKGSYTTRTISANNLTSTWAFDVVSGSAVNCPTDGVTDNEMVLMPSGSGKIKFQTSKYLSCNSKSSLYLPVPAGSAGSISLVMNSNSDSRYFQLYINGTEGAETQRLYSKLNESGITSDGKKGPQTFSFTSSDITTYNGKTYLHLKDNNTEMKVTSFTITLTTGTYAKGPQITTQPQGASYMTGQTIAALTVAATPATATFQWYSCDDANKTNAQPIENATEASYTPTAAGFYYVAVTDGGVTVNSDVAQITISAAEAPHISVSGAPAEAVKVGAEVILTATATGTPTPTITWYDGNDTSVDTGDTYTVPTDAAGTYTFYAVASNGVGSDATSAPQTIVVKAQVATPTFSPNGAYFEESQEVTLACTDADATIQYSTDGGTTWTDYTAAFTVTATTTVQAKAVKDGCIDSEVATATFTLFSPAELQPVSTATTWDWTNWNQTLELSGTTSPTNNDEYTFSDIALINGGITIPSNFNGDAIMFKGQYPVRSKKSQAGTWTIKTTVPGTLAITFSDTGSSISSGTTPAKRYLNINGVNTQYYTQRTGKSADSKTATVYVPAGDVVITSYDEDNNWQAIVVTKIVFTPIETVPVTITAAGAASFSSTQALDFSVVEGITAYKATAKSASYVHLDEVAQVPAGAGVIVKGAEGTYNVPVATGDVAELEGNLLVGTGENTFTVTSAEYEKVFKYVKTNTGVVGFQKAKVDWICQAGHAYLMLPETSAREFIGIFDEDISTGIEAIDNSQLTIDNDAPAYNLAGQKVGKGYKGIVIINGKKVVK